MPGDNPMLSRLLAVLTDALRKAIPNAGDRITRRVLRLYLRNSGFSAEAFAGPLVDLEERGWIKVSGETYTTTLEGARAFASEAPVATALAKAATEVVKAAVKAGKRRRR
jgi:hypothetical protein